MENLIQDYSIESTLNENLNELPFAFYCPETSGEVYWICDYDYEKRIVGTFKSEIKGDKASQSNFLKDMDEAMSVRDELIINGWLPMKKPEIMVTDPNGKERSLNRKERRFFERKQKQHIQKMSKLEGHTN